MNNDYDYCIECGCDLTHRDDGNDTCCWCLKRRFSLISITQEEKTNLQKKYSCQLLLENATPEQLKDKNQPSDAMIITYEFGGSKSCDLIRGRRGDIFDLYYDYFGTGVVKSIDFGSGTISPTLWKYAQKPQTKKKK